jgi:hypothetical protein
MAMTQQENIGDFPNMQDITKQMYEGKQQVKYPLMVRFANESFYYTTIEVRPEMLTDVVKFPEHVFATVDGTRVSFKRDEFDKMMDFYEMD